MFCCLILLCVSLFTSVCSVSHLSLSLVRLGVTSDRACRRSLRLLRRSVSLSLSRFCLTPPRRSLRCCRRALTVAFPPRRTAPCRVDPPVLLVRSFYSCSLSPCLVSSCPFHCRHSTHLPSRLPRGRRTRRRAVTFVQLPRTVGPPRSPSRQRGGASRVLVSLRTSTAGRQVVWRCHPCRLCSGPPPPASTPPAGTKGAAFGLSLLLLPPGLGDSCLPRRRRRCHSALRAPLVVKPASVGPAANRPVAWTNSAVARSTASCFLRGSLAPPSSSFAVRGGPLSGA